MHHKLLKIENEYVKAIYITCGHLSIDTISDSNLQCKCTITSHDHCNDLTQVLEFGSFSNSALIDPET